MSRLSRNNSVGTKYDADKPMWDLLPWEEVAEVVNVVTFGAKKYKPENWKQVEPKERYFAAAMRHLVAWKRGEKSDKETGLSPLAHAACDILFLMYKDKQGDTDAKEEKVTTKE